MIYRMATVEDLENVWNKDINNNLGDSRYIRWKKEYIDYNLKDEAKTFVAVNDNNDVIGQITLILKEFGKINLIDFKIVEQIKNENVKKLIESYFI